MILFKFYLTFLPLSLTSSTLLSTTYAHITYKGNPPSPIMQYDLISWYQSSILRPSFLLVATPTAVKYVKMPTKPGKSDGKIIPMEVIDLGLTHVLQPGAIVVDEARKYFYVSCLASRSIVRYSYDITILGVTTGRATGSLSENQFTFDNIAPLTIVQSVDVNAMALDSTANMMYFADSVLNRISSVSLEQPGKTINVEYQGKSASYVDGITSMSEVTGLAIGNRRIYFANGSNAISKGNVLSGWQKGYRSDDAAQSLTEETTTNVVDNVKGLCMSNTDIYFTDGISSVYAMPRSGGTPKKIAGFLYQSAQCQYNSDSNTIFVADSKSVFAFPANRRTSPLPPSSPGSNKNELILSGVQKVVDIPDAKSVAIIGGLVWPDGLGDEFEAIYTGSGNRRSMSFNTSLTTNSVLLSLTMILSLSLSLSSVISSSSISSSRKSVTAVGYI